jgi:hypothetical protein
MIGLAVDHETHILYVVVDPARFDASADALAKLQSIVDTAYDKSANEQPFDVEFKDSCHSAAELQGVQKSLDGQGWDPSARSMPLIWGLDPYTSTWKVTFDSTNEQSAAAEASLRQTFGDLVSVAETAGLNGMAK